MAEKNIDIIKAYMAFFKDKSDKSDLVETFVKDHRQKDGGYIELAKAFEFYNYLNDNKDEIEEQTGLKIYDILHPTKTPNQKWHLLISYLGMLQFEEKNPSFERVICPELWLWILETSFENETNETIVNIKNHAEHYKNREDYEGHEYGSKKRNKPTNEWKRFLKTHITNLEEKVIEQYNGAHNH